MNPLGISVVLGLLVGVWAQVNVQRPLCDSPEAEEAALVARDFLNAQHTHGYKYELNRIEDIKVYSEPNGDIIYVLEVDLLETDCHVLDPTPLANCTVRPKHFTAVEGDCDVVVRKVGGPLTVTAFKCKTEESREDICLGCYSLLPLNDTTALDFVDVSLESFNNISGKSYSILEVGRMSSQIVFGGPRYLAEYIVVEANCTDGICVPLNDPLAEKGLCTASGVNTVHTVDCKMFSTLVPIVDANSTVPTAPVSPPLVHVHGGSLSHKHGLRHHKLTAHHNPHLSTLLSAESAESAETVPVAPAVVDTAAAAAAAADPAPAADPGAAAVDPAVALDSPTSKDEPLNFIYKRDVSNAPVLPLVDNPAAQPGPIQLLPPCPGRVRYF